MKIRTDFVTNSSSSSFVIAFSDISKENNNHYFKKVQKLFEASLLVDNYDEDSSIIISTKKELKKYYKKRTSKDETLSQYFKLFPDEKKEYKKANKYIKNGYKILFKQIDYSNDENFKMIKDLKDNKNFIIISSF